MRRIALLAMLIAVLPGIADAAAPPCLTPREFGAVTRFALPAAITGANQRCAATLPADAFLPREGAALAARYAQAAAASWPDARAALLRIAGDGDHGLGATLRSTPDPSLQEMVRGTVAGFVAGRLPIERCPAVDTILHLLAPLPPGDTAQLIATVVGLAAASRARKLGPIAVCPA